MLVQVPPKYAGHGGAMKRTMSFSTFAQLLSVAIVLTACGGDSGNTSKAEDNNSGRDVGSLAEMGL